MEHVIPSSVNSTTGRFNAESKGASPAFTWAAAVSPALAELWAAHRFLTPRRSERSAEDAALLAVARPMRVGRLATWKWGSGPVVFLVHGWEGHGGQLSAFVRPLIDAGYAVVAFDAPAHGLSPGGTATIADFARALLAMKRRFGAPQAMIAHSLGSLGALLAQRQGLGARSLVVIAPPSPTDAVTRFGRALALPDAVLEGAKRRIEQSVGLPFAKVEPGSLARGIHEQVLVVHDVNDRESAFENAASVHSQVPGSELHHTSGLGHRRIVRDPGVVARAVAFVAQERPSRRSAA